jgi:hypothetical protein
MDTFQNYDSYIKYHCHKPIDLIYENESLASIKGVKILNHMSDYWRHAKNYVILNRESVLFSNMGSPAFVVNRNGSTCRCRKIPHRLHCTAESCKS